MRLSTAQQRNIIVTTLLLAVISLCATVIKRERDRVRIEEALNIEAQPSREKFDPNTVGIRELLQHGLTKEQAQSLLRYRAAGKVFRIKEDLITLYKFTDSIYYAIEPYIDIDPKFQYKKLSSQNTAPRATNGSSAQRGAQQQKGAQQLPVDLNNADSATLTIVSGIGPKTASAIVQYRTLLGGFHSAQQLRELSSIITESNYEKILSQISLNSNDISKIDVNFTPANELVRHPYISQTMARRWNSKRQLKGGYSTIEEMIKDDIMTEEAARKLQPYLLF